GKAFAEHYYRIFDNNRSSLNTIYQPQSILTWEGKVFQGQQAICTYINELPFQKVERKIQSIDSQPTIIPNFQPGVLVTITGTLVIDGEPKPLKYVQVFNLLPNQGSYLLLNDFFRFSLD
ncbi:hypothetical protein DICPUDRAFT_27457, partial [Dictyostelium purpureum]